MKGTRSWLDRMRGGAPLSDERAVVEHIPVPLLVADTNGTILTANGAFRRLLGASTNLEGLGVLDLVHPRDAHAVAVTVDEQSHSDRPISLTVRLRGGAGAPISCRTSVYPIHGTEGRQVRGWMFEPNLELPAQTEVLAGDQSVQAALDQAVNAITSASDTALAVQSVLDILGQAGSWTVGAFWRVSRMDDRLVCEATWNSPLIPARDFMDVTSHLTFAAGIGLPGRVWSRGEAEWLFDLSDDVIIRSLKAMKQGMSLAFAFPIMVHGRVVGVYEFFGDQRHWPSPDLLEATTAMCVRVARHLGQSFERDELRDVVETGTRRYDHLTEIVRDAVVEVDDRGRIIAANAATQQMFGYTRDELVGRALSVLMPHRMQNACMAGIARYGETMKRHMRWDAVELPGIHKNGNELLLEVSLAEYIEDGKRRFTGYMRDVTEQKRHESALLYQALHDSLTDLPNRTLLSERVQQSIAVAQRHGSPLALLLMDLDRFKEVNDTFGHHSGDVLLKEVARRLQNTLRDSDTVARLGGDEFAILLPGTDEPGAQLAASRLRDALKEPFILEGQAFDIGASIGIAMHPEHGTDTGSLMRRADVAMYAAKRTGAGFAVYTPDRDDNNAARLLLTSELRAAIENGDLVLHFQPKIDLSDSRTHQVEALVRWRHPERGLIRPDFFIPLAEETGLVKPLTAWVLRDALRQHREWRAQGLDIRIAVNVSAKTLHDPELLDMVTSLLHELDVEPSRLEVEITESGIMHDPERALETLTRLHNAGVWTSIDDFGTGYSSLGYLKTLPVDEIKIDKSFVIDMATNRDDASIVRSVVTLGHNLGLHVVAEGVDNQRTLDMLSAMGCDLAQGFFLSTPLPAAEATSWLKGYQERLPNAG